jgi:hypothetical protein
VPAFSLSAGVFFQRWRFLLTLTFPLSAGLFSLQAFPISTSLFYQHRPFLSALALLSVLTFSTVPALAFSTGSSHITGFTSVSTLAINNKTLSTGLSCSLGSGRFKSHHWPLQ